MFSTEILGRGNSYDVTLCEQQGKNRGGLGRPKSYSILDTIINFFLYPPFSGIAPCVGTAGTVHDAYT